MRTGSILVIISLICTLLTGCFGSNNQADSYRGITGTIEIGVVEDEATVPVTPEGTTIEIDRPGDPLNGLSLNVPAGSYTETLNFRISYTQIKSHSFGEAFNPLTPLITIDNGGSYSDEVMTVKIPVTVPEGHFAMGFLYNEASGMLEGLPSIAQDHNSITVATRHFSSIVISMVSDALLKKDLDSGFRPGADDWQFVNHGSYIAPDGHCSGQSTTAMWYFCTRPNGAGQPLYNRYDNNGDKPATPKFQYDDSLGYRFASVIQKESSWDSISRKFTKDYVAHSDETTLKMFAYAMQLTGEPQMVEIWNTQIGGGHAMIVYRITNGKLYIADPNYPGATDRTIEYANSEFKPYNSGANADEIAKGNGKAYDRIVYVAKTALIDWGKIATRWQEFKDKTIGNNLFSAYNIVWYDDDGFDWSLTDGIVTNKSLLVIGPTSNNRDIYAVIYKDEQVLYPNASGEFALNPGNNKFGILIAADINDVRKFIDFRYFNIVCSTLSIEPESLTGNTGQEYTFRVVVGTPVSGASYEWYLNNSLLQGTTAATVSYTFNNAGAYTLSVKQKDSTGKELGTASSSITINENPSTADANILTMLQNMKSVEAQVGGQLTFKFWHGESWSSYEGEIPAEERLDTSIGTLPVKPTEITWSGTTFSGKAQILDDPLNPIKYEVNGTVSSDGKTLLALNYSYEEFGYSEADKLDVAYATRDIKRIQLKGIPLTVGADTVTGALTGSSVKNYVVLLDSQRLVYKDGELIETIVYQSIDWSAAGTITTLDGTFSKAPYITINFVMK